MFLPMMLTLAIAQAPPIARTKWDVGYVPPSSVPSYGRLTARTFDWIVVHHTSFPDAPGIEVTKRYHLEISGFADIGYHFFIATDGTVYEGRPMDRLGAHAGFSQESVRQTRAALKAKDWAALRRARQKDPDWGAIGIVLDGDFFDEVKPSTAQRESLIGLIRTLVARFAIAPGHIIGHREVREKIIEAKGFTFAGEPATCPGPNGMHLVTHLRSEVFAPMGPPIP